MRSFELPKSVIDALYSRAETLERRWAGSGLPLGFPDRMIDAVLRFVEREKLESLNPSEAKGLLTSFWTVNARRDSARAKKKPQIISLDAVARTLVNADPIDQRISAGLIEGCRHILSRHGMRQEITEAFIQDILHEDPRDVLSAVKERCGFVLTQPTLRQWRRRHFPSAIGILNDSVVALGIDEVQHCHEHDTPRALSSRCNDHTDDGRTGPQLLVEVGA